jgi:hypothetical protein
MMVSPGFAVFNAFIADAISSWAYAKVETNVATKKK